MWPPRLLVATDDHIVRGLDKEQLVGHAARIQLTEHAHEVVEELAAARVHHDGGTADLPVRLTTEINELWNEYRREVVHAKVAEILHIARGERLSAPRQSRHDHGTEFLCGMFYIHHRHLLQYKFFHSGGNSVFIVGCRDIGCVLLRHGESIRRDDRKCAHREHLHIVVRIACNHDLIECQPHRVRKRLHADRLVDAGRVDVNARARILLRHKASAEVRPHLADVGVNPAFHLAQDELRYVLRAAEIAASHLRHHEIRRRPIGGEIVLPVRGRIDLRPAVPVHIPVPRVAERQELPDKCGVKIAGKERRIRPRADVCPVAADDGRTRAEQPREVERGAQHPPRRNGDGDAACHGACKDVLRPHRNRLVRGQERAVEIECDEFDRHAFILSALVQVHPHPCRAHTYRLPPQGHSPCRTASRSLPPP